MFPVAFESTLRNQSECRHPPPRPSTAEPSIPIRQTKNGQFRRIVRFGSGRRTRTSDLRVMSPTSCQLLHPAICLQIGSIAFACAKIRQKSGLCKYFRALFIRTPLTRLAISNKKITFYISRTSSPSGTSDTHPRKRSRCY